MKNGFRAPKKPTTAKAMKERLEHLEGLFQMLVTQVGNQLQMLQGEVKLQGDNIHKIDIRSLATLRLLQKGSEFTDAAHDELAAEINLEVFEDLSLKEDEELNLVSIDTPADVGHHVVMQIDVYAPDESGNRGEKIDNLSVIRSKVQLGNGQFPQEIETEVMGMSPRTSKEFKITIPKGASREWSEKEVIYDLTLLQVLEPETQGEEASN